MQKVNPEMMLPYEFIYGHILIILLIYQKVQIKPS